jgi:trk system potassium uptake protein TrkH
MPDSTTALTYAVHLRLVGRYLSQLALMLALLTTVPLAVSLALGAHAFSLRYTMVVAGLLVLAIPGLRRPEPKHLQTNEAIVIVSLAFVLTPLVMAFPLTAAGLPLEDALFEAVSAVTTTGLSTAGSVEGRPPMFLFARSWMQWFGGLGIAVLSVALLMGQHAAARRLAEPTEVDNIATTARRQARQVLQVYLTLTVLGSLLLWPLLGEPFGAVVHMLSTVSTGGFATSDASLEGLPSAAAWVLTLFSLLGAVPLLLYFHAAKGRPLELWRDPEVRALLVAVLLITLLLSVNMHSHMALAWDKALQHALMLGTSAQTTTGFASLPVAELDDTSKLLMILSMLVGGGSGSTAGGIKLLRLLVVLRLLQYFFRRTAMPPHAVAEPRLSGRVLEPIDVERVMLVVGLFCAVTAISWLAFLAYGYAPLDALFEVVSATGTVGLSTGISRPELETPLKLLLSFNMLLGRLEVLALLVLLYPRTWIGKRAS